LKKRTQRLTRLLLPLLLIPLIQPIHATPVYTAGVSAGHWASYTPINVTYHGTIQIAMAPQSIRDLNATSKTTITVQQLYTPTNVTAEQITLYKNSKSKTTILNGDLATFLGNLTYAIIAKDLSAGDPVWNSPYAPTINQTVSRNYLGVERTVDVLNISFTGPYNEPRTYLDYVWDQSSGLLLENRNLVVLDGGYVLYTDVRVESTNIFSNANSPSFTITASQPAPVTTDATSTSTITVTVTNGFSDTITLSDISPTGLQCNEISPNTITGHGTASLSCKSTNQASYNITIIGTSGPTTYTTTTIFTFTRLSQSPNAPPSPKSAILFETIIGIGLASIMALGGLVYRSRQKTRRKT